MNHTHTHTVRTYVCCCQTICMRVKTRKPIIQVWLSLHGPESLATLPCSNMRVEEYRCPYPDMFEGVNSPHLKVPAHQPRVLGNHMSVTETKSPRPRWSMEIASKGPYTATFHCHGFPILSFHMTRPRRWLHPKKYGLRLSILFGSHELWSSFGVSSHGSELHDEKNSSR